MDLVFGGGSCFVIRYIGNYMLDRREFRRIYEGEDKERKKGKKGGK